MCSVSIQYVRSVQFNIKKCNAQCVIILQCDDSHVQFKMYEHAMVCSVLILMCVQSVCVDACLRPCEVFSASKVRCVCSVGMCVCSVGCVQS